MQNQDIDDNRFFSSPGFKELTERHFIGFIVRPFLEMSAAFILDNCKALKSSTRIHTDGCKTYDLCEYIPTAQTAVNADNFRPDGFTDPVAEMMLAEKSVLAHFGRTLFAYDIADPYGKRGYLQKTFVLSKLLPSNSRFLIDDFIALLEFHKLDTPILPRHRFTR